MTSVLLFNLVINWGLPRNDRRLTSWTLFTTLEDLDFPDEFTLLSHTDCHMYEKTSRLSSFAQQVGLRVSPTRTEAMTLNVTNLAPE